MVDNNIVIESADAIRKSLGEDFDVCMVLGSGFGRFVDCIDNKKYIEYKDIPGFNVSDVPGHSNRLITGELCGKKLLVMQGRFHYYEGYTQDQVSFPIRVFYNLGIRKLVLTNASGGVNTDFNPGDMMLITDHINFSGNNPLIGKNIDPNIPRFPDMSEIYSKRLIKISREIMPDLKTGVYMFFTGPSYETPAEVRMARAVGADAVGMSTVPEAIVANALGIEVLGISCIANMASGVTDSRLNHEDILKVNEGIKDKSTILLTEILKKI